MYFWYIADREVSSHPGGDNGSKNFTFLVVALLVGITSDGRAAKAKWVGVVLPNDVRPGERGSGSIVLYPAAVQSLSGLTDKGAARTP